MNEIAVIECIVGMDLHELQLAIWMEMVYDWMWCWYGMAMLDCPLGLVVNPTVKDGQEVDKQGLLSSPSSDTHQPLDQLKPSFRTMGLRVK